VEEMNYPILLVFESGAILSNLFLPRPLLVLPSVQIDGKRLQWGMGVGGTDSSSQLGLDEIQHMAIIRATGKQRSMQTSSARAFFQVPDVEVKLSFYRVIASIHRFYLSKLSVL
jgi:hypothetical protein